MVPHRSKHPGGLSVCKWVHSDLPGSCSSLPGLQEPTQALIPLVNLRNGLGRQLRGAERAGLGCLWFHTSRLQETSLTTPGMGASPGAPTSPSARGQATPPFPGSWTPSYLCTAPTQEVQPSGQVAGELRPHCVTLGKSHHCPSHRPVICPPYRTRATRGALPRATDVMGEGRFVVILC